MNENTTNLQPQQQQSPSLHNFDDYDEYYEEDDQDFEIAKAAANAYKDIHQYTLGEKVQPNQPHINYFVNNNAQQNDDYNDAEYDDAEEYIDEDDQQNEVADEEQDSQQLAKNIQQQHSLESSSSSAAAISAAPDAISSSVQSGAAPQPAMAHMPIAQNNNNNNNNNSSNNLNQQQQNLNNQQLPPQQAPASQQPAAPAPALPPISTSKSNNFAIRPNVLNIKVQYEQEIRRFEVNSNCSFQELFKRVQEVFPPPCTITTIVYPDDEDEYITVSNEADWKHCLSFFQQQQKPVKIFAGTPEIFAVQLTGTPTRTPKSPRTPAHHAYNGMQLGNSLQWLKGPVIGTGVSGTVHLCINLVNYRFMVVKEINMEKFPVKEIAKEIQILASLQHPHIVKYLAMARQEKIAQIFMEYVSGGSISNLLNGSHGFGGLPEKVVREYARQLLLAVQYIHNNNIVHCDIKCGNILINENGMLKLADFGHAMQLGQDGSVSDGAIKGTPLFTAPEVISNEHRYTRAADVWSLGCTVIEMFTNGSPWKNFLPQWHQMAILYHIREAAKKNEIPTIPDTISDEGKRFLLKCFVIDPAKRATIEDLLQESFIMNNDEFNIEGIEDDEEAEEDDDYSSYHSEEEEDEEAHKARPKLRASSSLRALNEIDEENYDDDDEENVEDTGMGRIKFRKVVSEEELDEGEYSPVEPVNSTTPTLFDKHHHHHRNEEEEEIGAAEFDNDEQQQQIGRYHHQRQYAHHNLQIPPVQNGRIATVTTPNGTQLSVHQQQQVAFNGKQLSVNEQENFGYYNKMQQQKLNLPMTQRRASADEYRNATPGIIPPSSHLRRKSTPHHGFHSQGYYSDDEEEEDEREHVSRGNRYKNFGHTRYHHHSFHGKTSFDEQQKKKKKQPALGRARSEKTAFKVKPKSSSNAAIIAQQRRAKFGDNFYPEV